MATETSEPKRTGRPPGKKGARQTIREVVDAGVTKKAIQRLLEDALSTTVAVDAECPDCGATMRAKAPDIKKQLDVVIALLEQAEGRPEQRAPGELTVVIERPPR